MQDAWRAKLREDLDESDIRSVTEEIDRASLRCTSSAAADAARMPQPRHPVTGSGINGSNGSNDEDNYHYYDGHADGGESKGEPVERRHPVEQQQQQQQQQHNEEDEEDMRREGVDLSALLGGMSRLHMLHSSLEETKAAPASAAVGAPAPAAPSAAAAAMASVVKAPADLFPGETKTTATPAVLLSPVGSPPRLSRSEASGTLDDLAAGRPDADADAGSEDGGRCRSERRHAL